MRTGQTVTYTDHDGELHDAVITRVFGDEPGPRVLDLTVDGIAATAVRHESAAPEGEPRWAVKR